MLSVNVSNKSRGVKTRSCDCSDLASSSARVSFVALVKCTTALEVSNSQSGYNFPLPSIPLAGHHFYVTYALRNSPDGPSASDIGAVVERGGGKRKERTRIVAVRILRCLVQFP